MYKLARIFGVQLPDNYIQQAYNENDEEKALSIFKTYLNTKAEEPRTSYTSLLPAAVVGAGLGWLVAKKSGKPMAAVAGVGVPALLGYQFKSMDDNDIERAKLYKHLSDQDLKKILDREMGITREYKEKHPNFMMFKESLSDPVILKTAGVKTKLAIGGGLAALLYGLLKTKKPIVDADTMRRVNKVNALGVKPVYEGRQVVYGYQR